MHVQRKNADSLTLCSSERSHRKTPCERILTQQLFPSFSKTGNPGHHQTVGGILGGLWRASPGPAIYCMAGIGGKSTARTYAHAARHPALSLRRLPLGSQHAGPVGARAGQCHRRIAASRSSRGEGRAPGLRFGGHAECSLRLDRPRALGEDSLIKGDRTSRFCAADKRQSRVAQLVEQVTVNHRVGGSSPSSGADDSVRFFMNEGPHLCGPFRVYDTLLSVCTRRSQRRFRRGRPPRNSKCSSFTTLAMDRARPSQRTRANWRAESQAALYQTPAFRPG